jgi:hypothetical protein
MTPEPTGGYYKTAGVEAFIRKYGYPDMTGQAGRQDRLNFGGIHRIDKYHERTGLSMVKRRPSGAIPKSCGTGIASMHRLSTFQA